MSDVCGMENKLYQNNIIIIHHLLVSKFLKGAHKIILKLYEPNSMHFSAPIMSDNTTR